MSAITTELNVETTEMPIQPYVFKGTPPLPADHPVNRLGEQIESCEGGTINRWKNRDEIPVFFAWAATLRGAVMFQEINLAREHIGAPKPRIGMSSNGFGNERIGKVVERLKNGEIRKTASGYYVWPLEAEEATRHWNLGAARNALGHNPIRNDLPKTKKKSDYPQNQTGYDPHSGQSSVKAAKPAK